MPPFVIYNPGAGSGATGRDWPAIAEALRAAVGPFESAATTASRHAARLAAAALTTGARTIIAVGGDGTLSEVVDGLMTSDNPDALRDVMVGLVPAGSGNDFARGLGIDSKEASYRRLHEARSRRLDIGRIHYRDDTGADAVRHFCNIASFGVSGAIARAVNARRSTWRFAAKAMYQFHTVAALLRYRICEARIEVDGHLDLTLPIAAVVIANGRFFGGGMKIAPQAEPDDGRFDVVVIRGRSKRELIAALRLCYTGAHVTHPAVRFERGARIVAAAPGADMLLEIDGETPGRLPARFEILPKALAVYC
jgi:diacylglycerol kinase (ATP)